MKRFCIRSLSVILILAMFVGFLPASELTDLIPRVHAEDGKSEITEIPEAFSLEESALSEELRSGLWRYALREEDGYAVITGYDGEETSVTVPMMLDGVDVVGLAPNALPKAESVTLHGNILLIAEDAFGEGRPEICALNGTWGLFWADRHDCIYTTGKDYDLVPGVIDYTDAMQGRVQKRGDTHVAFGRLEAMRLTVGSIFWMRDTRGMEFFFRVTELTESGETVIATVEIPDNVGDAIINYETTVELHLTEEDFTPADGVIVEGASAAGKDSSGTITDTTPHKLTLPIAPGGKFKKNGISASISGQIDVEVNNTVTYTVEIINGEVTATELTKIQEFSYSVGIEVEGSQNYTKRKELAKKAAEKLSRGEKPAADEEAEFEAIYGGSLSLDKVSTGLSWADLEKAEESYETWEKLNKPDDAKVDTGLGHYAVQTPYFNISFAVSVNLTVGGSVTFQSSTSNITKEHYDSAKQDWVVDYSNGNSSTREQEKNLTLEVKASLALEVEVSVGAFFVSNLSLSFKLGVEAGCEKKFTFDSEPNIRTLIGCSVCTVTPFMSLTVYGGVWVAKNVGAKVELFSRKWTAQELCGKEYLWCSHINVALPDHRVHKPDECPLDEMKEIRYHTRSSIQIQTRKVLAGETLTAGYSIDVSNEFSKVYYDELRENWQGGEFLGWAWKESDTTPTAAEPGKAFRDPDGTGKPVTVSTSIDLYAVWENQNTVTFDSDGGSSVSSQLVPAGGYAERPENPEKEGDTFLCWRDEKNAIWDFNRNSVSGDLTLKAEWLNSPAESDGTTETFYIGSYDEVSADCKYNPNYNGTSSALNFEYEEFTGADGIKAIRITGLKNSPEHLVIPKQLPSKSVLTEDTMLPVADISDNAFANCGSLRSVYCLIEDYSLDVDGMFQGCGKLEYVELPRLLKGRLSSSMFSGCSSLKCVKVQPGLKEIGSYAFRNTAITDLTLPAGVSAIGLYAFENCSSLEELYIPDTVRTISKYGSGS
ncbi:MAG: leucine-rich repeat protein [Oscillospiraceae bacterium]|nr:leucine-rich repeat protein [Oscillospiraceae bacterium]